MKRLLGTFLICWGGIFLLSFFTANIEISFIQRLGYAAVLALVAPALALTNEKRKRESCVLYTSCDVEIHLPLNPQVLYRIKGQKIYKGMDVVPAYEIRGNKIYPNLSSTFAFRIENGRVYRGMEKIPFLEIKGNKVYHNSSKKIVYEIRKEACNNV